MKVAFVAILLAGGCGEANGTVSRDNESSPEPVTTRFERTQSSDDLLAPHTLESSTGVFDFTHFNARSTNTTGSGGETKNELLVEKVLYLPLKGTDPIDPDDPCYGKEWGTFNFDDESSALLGLPRTYLAPVPFDPSSATKSLLDADARLTALGSETLRGTRTTHYSVDLNQGTLQKWFVHPDNNSTVMLLEVWIDGRDRLWRAQWVERIENSVEQTPHGETAEDVFTLTTRVDLWDFGVLVDTVAPPAETTCDFPSFFGRSMTSFGS